MKFRQKGIGFTGLLLLIIVLGAVLTMGMKVIPMYMDHNTMTGILEGIAVEPGMAGQRDSVLIDLINKRFKINNVRDFNVKDNIAIKRDATKVRVVMDYETRIPLAGNLDLIAAFNAEVELKN